MGLGFLDKIGNIFKIISDAMGKVVFKIGAYDVTWGALANSLLFGGVAISSVLASSKKSDLDFASPTYQGPIQTQTSQDLPVPLLYGTCKLAGNRIWQDPDGTYNIKRLVAFAEK
jgi:predicted phage tail protein